MGVLMAVRGMMTIALRSRRRCSCVWWAWWRVGRDVLIVGDVIRGVFGFLVGFRVACGHLDIRIVVGEKAIADALDVR